MLIWAMIAIFGAAGLGWTVSCAIRGRSAQDAIPGVFWLGAAFGMLLLRLVS